MSLPPPSTGVRVAPLGRGRVAHDAVAGLVHVLNPSAAVVWDACAEGVTRGTLVEVLVEVTGERPEVIGTDVDAHLAHLREVGLVDRRVPVPAPWRLGPDPAPRPLATRPVAVLDAVVTLHGEDRDVLDAVDDLLAPLAVRGPSRPAFALETGEGGTIRVTGQGHDEVVADLGALLDLVPSLLNRVATASSAALALHAAAVRAPSGEVVVLPAASGSGKSTLAARLVRGGWDYLTDEAVAIRHPDRVAVAYPKPLALDGASRALLGLAPGPRAHVAPDELRPGAAVAPGPVAPVDLVVLPGRVPGAALVEEALGPEEAVAALAGHALNLSAAGPPGLAALAALATEVPCRRLVHDDLEGAAAAVEALVAGPSDRLG